jgi:hypothetical protein
VAAGVLADRFGMMAAIIAVATLTLASGLVAAVRLPETHRTGSRSSASPEVSVGSTGVTS